MVGRAWCCRRDPRLDDNGRTGPVPVHAAARMCLKLPPPLSWPPSAGTVTYEWRAFDNQARTDGLRLTHWVKCYRDAQGNVTPAEAGEYSFAKYNKHVSGICTTEYASQNMRLRNLPEEEPDGLSSRQGSKVAASNTTST